jgi:hypothetical protein
MESDGASAEECGSYAIASESKISEESGVSARERYTEVTVRLNEGVGSFPDEKRGKGLKSAGVEK